VQGRFRRRWLRRVTGRVADVFVGASESAEGGVQDATKSGGYQVDLDIHTVSYVS